MARRSKSKAIARRGLMLVLSSPSGAGKTTLSRMLLTEERIALSISVTTRARRPGEVHGRHYHFIDRNRFDQLRNNGDLLEYAEVFGNFYGTPRKPVEKALKHGRHFSEVLAVHRLQMKDVQRQTGFAADPKNFVERFGDTIALAALVRHVNAAVPCRNFRQRDDLFGVGEPVGYVHERRRQAEGSVLHRVSDQLPHL